MSGDERAEFEAALDEADHLCMGTGLCENGCAYVSERAAVLAIFDRIVQRVERNEVDVAYHLTIERNVLAKQVDALRAERDAAAAELAFRDANNAGHPGMCCGQCVAEVAALKAERSNLATRELVEKIAAERDAALDIVHDLRRKLARAGVEGSPPPGEDTTIGSLIGVKAALLAEVAALTAERKQIQFDVQPLQDIAPASAWGENVCAWAAGHIAALTADNERLRAAIREWAEAHIGTHGGSMPPGDSCYLRLIHAEVELHTLAPHATP